MPANVEVAMASAVAVSSKWTGGVMDNENGVAVSNLSQTVKAECASCSSKREGELESRTPTQIRLERRCNF